MVPGWVSKQQAPMQERAGDGQREEEVTGTSPTALNGRV